MPIHLHPTTSLAERALLPGDPGRALALAQSLLEQPLMFNHNRGLWGYTGEAKDGSGPLTIQSTGIGAPSAAIVLEELIELGLRRAIRVGTCGALDPKLKLGELLVACAAQVGDGTSRALGARVRIAADAGLTGALRAAAPAVRVVEVRSSDLFYDERRPAAGGPVAVEMEAAALFALGSKRGVAVGCVLAVSDLLGSGPKRVRLDDDALADAEQRTGALALAGLTL